MASGGGGGGKGAKSSLDSLMMAYTDLSGPSKGASFKGPALKDVQRAKAAGPTFKASNKARDWSSLSQNLEDAFAPTTQQQQQQQMPFQPMFGGAPAAPAQEPVQDDWGDFQSSSSTAIPQQTQQQTQQQQTQQQQTQQQQMQQQQMQQQQMQQQQMQQQVQLQQMPPQPFQQQMQPLARPPPQPSSLFQSPSSPPAPAAPHQHILYQAQPKSLPLSLPTPPKEEEDDDFADFISAAPKQAAPPAPQRGAQGPPAPSPAPAPAPAPVPDFNSLPVVPQSQRPRIKPVSVGKKTHVVTAATTTSSSSSGDSALGTFGDFASPTEPSKPAFGSHVAPQQTSRKPPPAATPDSSLYPPPKQTPDFSLHAPPKQPFVRVKENPINAFADFSETPQPSTAAAPSPMLQPLAARNPSDKYDAFRRMFSDDDGGSTEAQSEMQQQQPAVESQAKEDDFGDFAFSAPAAAPSKPVATAAPAPLPKLPASSPLDLFSSSPLDPLSPAAGVNAASSTTTTSSQDLFSSLPPMPTAAPVASKPPKGKKATINMGSAVDVLKTTAVKKPPSKPASDLPVGQAIDLLATMSLQPQKLAHQDNNDGDLFAAEEALQPPPPKQQQPESPVKSFPLATSSTAAPPHVVPWIADTPPPPPDNLAMETYGDEFFSGDMANHSLEEPEPEPEPPKAAPTTLRPAAASIPVERSLSPEVEGMSTSRKSSGSSLNLQESQVQQQQQEESSEDEQEETASEEVEREKKKDSPVLSSDDESLLSDWLSALIEVEKLFSSANAKFASLEGDQEVLSEVLGAPECVDYLKNLSEIYRVALRIEVSFGAKEAVATSQYNLKERFEAIGDLWRCLRGQHAAASSSLPGISAPSHLRSGSEARSNCGVCQLDVNLGVACEGEDCDMNAAVLSHGPREGREKGL